MESSRKIVQEERLPKDSLNPWSYCESLYQHLPLDQILSTLEEKSHNFQDCLTNFKEYLEAIPLCVLIQKWLKEQAYPQATLQAFDTFYELEILTVRINGDFLTVKHVNHAYHLEIMERIRCITSIEIAYREKLVSIYFNFGLFLSHFTMGIVPPPVDPDREKTKHRLLPLEKFWEFSSYLSERDSLIAALMYYTGRQLNEVLNLQIKDVHPKEVTITFKTYKAFLPHHISLRLRSFLFDKKASDLLFTNRKDGEVNRTHVLTAFKKASNKMSSAHKITPKTLIISSL